MSEPSGAVLACDDISLLWLEIMMVDYIRHHDFSVGKRRRREARRPELLFKVQLMESPSGSINDFVQH